eukprot:GEMP01008664.1.p1 GENE.GEMP01008664.1~~GEMP01008664.1.p1  ORF type:complete len:636 (+),score=113.98 GEMP01008664.1:118-2025(+)
MLVYTWGKGEGTLPRKMEEAPRHTRDLALGEDHTLLLTDFGELRGWGRDKEGQIGDLDFFSHLYIVKVACGSKHSVALTARGELFEWGLLLPMSVEETDREYANRRQGFGTNILDDSNGFRRRIVMDSELRYLGVDLSPNERDDAEMTKMIKDTEVTRIRISVPRKANVPPVAEVACGYAHTICLTIDGDVYCSGYNDKCQLGVGTRKLSPEYTKVDLQNVKRVAAGNCHSVALAQDGRLYVWGFGTFGQLGTGKKEARVPQEVIFPEGAGRCMDVSCGEFHTVALTDGGLYAFGHKDAVPGDSHLSRRPVKMDVSVTPHRVFCGGQTSFVVRDDKCLSWGYNQKHQLGRPCFTRGGNVPMPVDLPSDDVVKVSIGQNRATAIVRDRAFGGLIASLLGSDAGCDDQFGNTKVHAAIFDMRCPKWREITPVDLSSIMPLLPAFKRLMYTDYCPDIAACARVAAKLNMEVDRTREEETGWVREGNKWVMRTEPIERTGPVASRYKEDILGLIGTEPKEGTVEIVIGVDRSIFIDRFLLSQLTPYFEVLLTRGFMESETPKIDLSPSIADADAFIEMIAHLFIGEPVNKSVDPYALLRVAHQFDASTVRGYAERRLLDEYSLEELAQLGELCPKLMAE